MSWFDLRTPLGARPVRAFGTRQSACEHTDKHFFAGVERWADLDPQPALDVLRGGPVEEAVPAYLALVRAGGMAARASVYDRWHRTPNGGFRAWIVVTPTGIFAAFRQATGRKASGLTTALRPRPVGRDRRTDLPAFVQRAYRKAHAMKRPSEAPPRGERR